MWNERIRACFEDTANEKAEEDESDVQFSPDSWYREDMSFIKTKEVSRKKYRKTKEQMRREQKLEELVAKSCVLLPPKLKAPLNLFDGAGIDPFKTNTSNSNRAKHFDTIGNVPLNLFDGAGIDPFKTTDSNDTKHFDTLEKSLQTKCCISQSEVIRDPFVKQNRSTCSRKVQHLSKPAVQSHISYGTKTKQNFNMSKLPPGGRIVN